MGLIFPFFLLVYFIDGGCVRDAFYCCGDG